MSSPGKGKPLQRKVKPPKKHEEKEKKGKGKPQEDELKDSLAEDDSSSTTTETSSPDTDPLPREVGRPAGQGSHTVNALRSTRAHARGPVLGSAQALPGSHSLQKRHCAGPESLHFPGEQIRKPANKVK